MTGAQFLYMEYQEYPKYLYHRKLTPITVLDPEEESGMSKAGWVTHPDLLKPSDAPIPHKPVK